MPSVSNLQKLPLTTGFSCEYASQLDAFPTISNHGKIVANHLLDNEITDQQKFDRGVTHLQKIYDTTFEKGRKCFVLLPDGFAGSNPSQGQIEAFGNSIANLITPNAAIGDQFTEAKFGPIPIENYFAVAREFYKQMCVRLGISGAGQNNFFGTYDSGQTNFNEDFFVIVGVDSRNPTHARFKAALGSEAGARKRGRNEDTENYSSPQQNDQFYAQDMHLWCNSFSMALYANDGNPKDWLFYLIFEIQRKYAAKIDAKTVAYSSPWSQSVLTAVNTHSRNPGWFHQDTGGYWLMQNWHVVPFQYMLQLGFFGCLLGEGCYLWESGVKWSKNKLNRKKLPTGEGYPQLPVWVSEGGSEPTLETFTDGNMYPQYPETGADAMMVGVHWYHRIKDIVNASSGIAYALYSSNGTDVTVRPGDPRLFRRGFRNYGQDTVLYLAQAEKGIHLACEAGGQTVLIYCNPYGVPTEKETIVSKFNGNFISLGDLEKGILHVFIYTNNSAS